MSSLFVPCTVDMFKFVGVDPWPEGIFVLLFLIVCYHHCPNKYTVREYNDIFIIAYALVIVWSSGQCISLAVSFPGDVTHLEIELH